MARMNFSRSTSAPRSRTQAQSGGMKNWDFKPEGLDTAGVTTNAANAADAVSTSAIYGELRANAPNYDDIASTAEEARMNERVASMTAEANMANAGINASAKIAAAEEKAKGLEAEGDAAKKSGMFSAIGGIASAALPLAMMSDETTKHTIDELENACAVLRELKPVTFFYKEEFSSSPERMHYGFIAQEYQKVMPDATYYDETIGKLCIDPTELISLLVRANQELQARVSRMEAKQALATV